MIISRRSQLTGELHIMVIRVRGNDLNTWINSGRPIEEVMPYLSVEEQRFIATGVTQEEFDRAQKLCEGVMK